MDLKMPGTSGLDLVPELTAKYPGIQVVVLTGYGSIATAVEAVRRGAVNYLDQATGYRPDPRSVQQGAGCPVGGWHPIAGTVEWEHIQRILHDCNGNISLAARKLGLHRRSLQRKLGKLPPLE